MTTSRKFAHYAILLLLLFVLICFLPILFTKLPICVADFSNTGQIGDTIGGIIGPFVAIIASCLTFLAFWVQYKANEQQRYDIALERFENTLFQLIQRQESLINNLHYSPIDSADKLYGENFTGRHVFDILYSKKAYFYDMDNRIYGLKAAIEQYGIKVYEADVELRRLDHYFRHLYGIFKYIDETDIIDFSGKYKYAHIVQSGLSQYELVFLFYNGLSKGQDEFKKLIEKYALLKNLDIDILATEKERQLYKTKNLMEYNDKDMCPDKKYKCGAFLNILDYKNPTTI